MACNATLAPHLCYVNDIMYTLPSQREFRPPVLEEPLGTDSHQTISKWSNECWLLIGHKKCFVLLCLVFSPSSFREFVHDICYLATVARFVHQAFLTRNEGTTDESKNVSDAISKSNSFCTEKILLLTDHNVS